MRTALLRYYKAEERYRRKYSKSIRKSFRAKLKRTDLSDGSSYKGYMWYRSYLD